MRHPLSVCQTWVKRVLDMLYRRAAGIAPHYGDNIKAQLCENVELFDIGVGANANIAYLPDVDGVLGLGNDIGRACLHLDKHHLAAIRRPRDDVDVAMAEPPVALHDVVAPVAQESGGKLLAPFASVVVLSHNRIVRLVKHCISCTLQR